MKAIKQKRIELRISESDLSEATDIPEWKIKLIEQGSWHPTRMEHEEICAVLGLDPNEKTGANQ